MPYSCYRKYTYVYNKNIYAFKNELLKQRQIKCLYIEILIKSKSSSKYF